MSFLTRAFSGRKTEQRNMLDRPSIPLNSVAAWNYLVGGGHGSASGEIMLSDELTKYQDDLADIQRHGADSLAEQSISFQLSTGAVSAHAAAISLATLNTKVYTQALSDLQQQQRAADGVGDVAESQRVGRQIATVQANRQVQVQSDNQSISSTTSLAQLQQMLTVNMPQVLTQTFGKFIEDFNDALLDSKRGQFGKNIKNAAANGLRTIGKAGLQKAEGGLLGAFGLGKQPMPVKIVGGIPGLSGLGGSGKGGLGGFSMSDIGGAVRGTLASLLVV